jgi:Uma2 family endonuclease
MATIPRILSYEEWLQMPPAEDGRREEVVNGEIQVLPPPQLLHALIIQRLISRIIRQIDEKQISIVGSVFGLMIRQEPLTCREPDLALFWTANMVVRDGMVWSAPELVVEVISPSETKRRKRAKLDDYASIGVPEAWLISPEAQLLEILLLRDGKLVLDKIIAEGEIRPTRFPDVGIPIAEIWPE